MIKWICSLLALSAICAIPLHAHHPARCYHEVHYVAPVSYDYVVVPVQPVSVQPVVVAPCYYYPAPQPCSMGYGRCCGGPAISWGISLSFR